MISFKGVERKFLHRALMNNRAGNAYKLQKKELANK